MGATPFQDFGSDEHRAIEAIAALLDLMPRMPYETDDALFYRMVDWGMQQGPRIRQPALESAVWAMVKAGKKDFMKLTAVGMDALHAYNSNRRGSTDKESDS